ncbi:MAG: ABC transporter substrate-binding protein [Roseburia sp.]|nr:ABC transporter substrate-binding protein [Roseburia sp.]MCM1278634.1 ABC transporter substrate-binding protein [Robinsoniella sp.]
MKKKLISTLLCVSMVATMLVGCGGGNDAPADDGGSSTTDDAGDDTEAETDAETEGEDEGGSASAEGGKVYYLNFKPESDDMWQQIAAEYTEATGTEVKVVTAASGQYEATLTSEIVKEDAPTLFQINGPVGYQNWKDYCMDLKDTDYYSWLLDKSLAIEGDDGGVYGIPYVVEGYGIIYNQAIMDKYFATEGAKAASMDEINNFAKLKEVVEDMTAKKDELGIDGVFASTSLLPGEDWRWQTHLANLPVYYELKDKGVSDIDELEFTYAENYKNIFDLYINNSCSAPGTLTTMDVTSSMAEFALGQVAMVQNGNWGWGQINDVAGNTVTESDVKFLPIYTGVSGEESQGLCVGTENFYCVNSKASEADQAATIAFLEWLYSSAEGKNHVTNDLGFIAPFNTFEDSEKPTDPLAQEVLRYMEDSSKTSVSWNFTIFPSQSFKDDFGFALGDYCNGSKTWDEVVDTVKTRWAEEKAATATAE